MKKIVLTTLICMMGLVGCSKKEEKVHATANEKVVDAQTEELIKSLNSTYLVQFKHSVDANKVLLDYKINENQNIKVYVNTDGSLSHVFVEQAGNQPLNDVKSQLSTTCKIVSNMISPNLSKAIDTMEQQVEKYEKAGVSAQTATTLDHYNLMLDISRYQIADCLISKKPVNTIVKTFSEPVIPTEISPEQARNFAKKLYQKIDDDEKFLRDAYQLKEQQTINKYQLKDWPNYVNVPYGEAEAKMQFGHPYFPNSQVASPYTICDAAFSELYSWAGTMNTLLKEDTAVMRKIVREHEQNYLESKAECSKRVKMTYDQAYDASENE